jgi:hypothetical protein
MRPESGGSNGIVYYSILDTNQPYSKKNSQPGEATENRLPQYSEIRNIILLSPIRSRLKVVFAEGKKKESKESIANILQPEN